MKRLKKNPIEINIEPKQDYVRKKGISKTEIIRESLDKSLREIHSEEDPGVGLIGHGNSDKRNLSNDHDKFLAQYAR
jgi:hypothetical protein